MRGKNLSLYEKIFRGKLFLVLSFRIMISTWGGFVLLVSLYKERTRNKNLVKALYPPCCCLVTIGPDENENYQVIDKLMSDTKIAILPKHTKEEIGLIQKLWLDNPFNKLIFDRSRFPESMMLLMCTEAMFTIKHWKANVSSLVEVGPDGGLVGKQKSMATAFVNCGDPFFIALLVHEFVTYSVSGVNAAFNFFGELRPISPARRRQEGQDARKIVAACNDIINANITLKKLGISYAIRTPEDRSTLDRIRLLRKTYVDYLANLQKEKVQRYSKNGNREYASSKHSRHQDDARYLIANLRDVLSYCFDTSAESILPILLPLARTSGATTGFDYKSIQRKLKKLDLKSAKEDFKTTYSEIIKKLPPDQKTSCLCNFSKNLSKI